MAHALVNSMSDAAYAATQKRFAEKGRRAALYFRWGYYKEALVLLNAPHFHAVVSLPSDTTNAEFLSLVDRNLALAVDNGWR